MSWIFIAILSYFITAITFVVDKFLLTKSIPSPVAYSFYIGILSIFAFVLAPFGLEWPGVNQFLLSIFVGAVFLFALIMLFTAIKGDELSRAAPIIGGLTPVFVYFLSFLFLGERLDETQIMAFILLILGGVLISIKKHKDANNNQRYFTESIKMALLASLLFGIFYVSVKFVFISQPFISGFVWTRLGSFFAALFLLIIPAFRSSIFSSAKIVERKIGALFVMNKALAGCAFVLLNYAIFLGSATLVNALQGVLYAFILFALFLISKKMPYILKEEITRRVVIQKIFSVLLIGAGFTLLVL